MTESTVHPVLVLAPRGRDAELTRAMLVAQGLPSEVCTHESLLAGIAAHAGCAIVTQEALDSTFRARLAEVLEAQPPWSDFPIILLVNARTTAALATVTSELGNVTVLERPIAPATLLATVRAALRGRVRQYEARAAIQQRDQFLAMLGHELRNPLAAIVLAAKLASEGVDRSQLEARLDVIERQSNVLARLVDDLLDVARVTTGKVRLRSEAVDVDAAIRACITALDERARNRGISVTLASTSGAVIEGDTVRIEQVFSNLISNAIKYSPSGRSVRITSALVDGVCEIRVRDQGIGIAPEMQPRVFDLFAQVDGSIERAEGGMGIGLTLVERLVRLHGGSVEVISAGLGLGSEFVVRLPVGHPPVAANVIRLEPRSDRVEVRVVLVEDNPDLRELTRDLLETLACTVELATDGHEGVDMIIRSRPDLALVDIGLPLLDGFGVARKVREVLGANQLLVAVTGYGLDQDRDEALRAGFDLHVTKPLAIDVLRTLIDKARNSSRRVAQS